MNKNEYQYAIPLHAWNKKIKGVERGKTPIDNDWQKKNYSANKNKVDKWFKDGFNVGYRIPKGNCVIDIDPRNNKGARNIVIELLGYRSWKELLRKEYVVQTGGGGWHIYCHFPEGENPKEYAQYKKENRGIDFKKSGFVVLTGSKHPNGKMYEKISKRKDFNIIAEEFLDEFYRGVPESNGDKLSGEITPDQLRELLSIVPVEEFEEQQEWQELMMGCHHATDGEGLEVFSDWSSQHSSFGVKKGWNLHTIKVRWESCSSAVNDGITFGTVKKHLRDKGIDISGFQAKHEFAGIADEEDEEDQGNWDDIDVTEVEYEDDIDHDDLETEIRALHPNSNVADVVKVLTQLIRLDAITQLRYDDMLVGENKYFRTQAKLNKAKAATTMTHSQNLSERLADLMFKNRYNNKRHLLNSDGVFWEYRSTHWVTVHNNVIKRRIDSFVEKHREALVGNIKVNMKTVVAETLEHMATRSAVVNNRAVNDQRKLSIINCANGEVWIHTDGTHSFHEHTYKSYLLSVLDVKYDEKAECPLWLDTLEEIFDDFDDADDIIRHLGEVLGYLIQPNKDIAGWWLFRGPGGDGKSTILKILNGIMGETMLFSDQSLLSSGGSMGNNHASADLVGKLVIAIEELEVSKSLNDAGLKKFSEKTKMLSNPKGKAAFQFDYVGGLIMCSNTYPFIKDVTQGMRRRANIIPFSREFVKEGDADINRARDILESGEEMSGILNWLLAGLERLRDRGEFKKPASCIIVEEEWLVASSKIASFVKTKCVEKRGSKILIGDFFTCFDIWTDEEEITHTLSPRPFAEELRRLGYVVRNSTGNQVYVFGLEVKKYKSVNVVN